MKLAKSMFEGQAHLVFGLKFHAKAGVTLLNPKLEQFGVPWSIENI